jgi:hypothetical protein
MKLHPTLWATLALCLPVFILSAEELLTHQTAEGEIVGWKSLHERSGTETGDVWTLMEEGVLVCRGTPRGYLYTERDYADFTLSFEWRYPPGSVSGKGGVLLRTIGEPKIWPRCLEVQLNAQQSGDFWGIDGYVLSADPGRTERMEHDRFGALTHVARMASVEKAPGAWNHGWVTLQGGTVTVWMNGKLVNQATDCDTTPGKIVLTAEGNEIHFRNLSLTSGGSPSGVTTHPVPDPSLLSSDYEILVNGQKLEVYRARTLDPPFADQHYDYGGSYSFANFDMGGPVTLRLSSGRSLRNAVIRPKRTDVQFKVLDDHTLSVTLMKPCKFSLEPDGKKGPLLLFANPPETLVPTPEAQATRWFGPGVHTVGRLDLSSGQTLYLAGGAVVKGAVAAQGDDIRILGRGILDGSDYAWRKGPYGVTLGIQGTNVLVQGITIRGSSHWTIVPRGSRRVTIRNVKLCNSRVQNDDGINPCNSQDVLITDCFIRSDDDCIALKGLDFRAPNSNVERITVENSILWCDRARIFLLGHESRAAYMRDIVLRNLDVIHFSMTPFLLEPGEDMQLENVTIEDVRLFGEGQREFIRLKPVVNQYMRKKVPGHIRNITFRNVELTGEPGAYRVQLEGADSEHTVQGVGFENVSILDHQLTRDSPHVAIGRHVDGVRFGP